mmetsp:Transcript_19588/g.32217  ORF Transcript_19588/g.32217 Transcript_19588/m.32217 type:complete len:518 (+) Transcript_19588:450-2003(+)
MAAAHWTFTVLRTRTPLSLRKLGTGSPRLVNSWGDRMLRGSRVSPRAFSICDCKPRGGVGFHTKVDIEDDNKLGQAEQLGVTWKGLYSNVGLVLLKGVVGVQSGSYSLIADAFHSTADLAGDIVALASIHYSHRPPDSKQPYGYGHYESLGTLVMSTLLISGGVGIGYSSCNQLVDLAQGVTQQPMAMVPAALAAAAFSVAIKEYMYRITVEIGKRTKSPVVVANAWHHRTDAFSSVVALIGIGGAAFGLNYLDPIAGLLVAGMVIKAGGDVAIDAMQDLTDRTRDSDFKIIRGVYKIARDLSLEPQSGIVDAHAVRVRRLGHYFLLDFHLRVDARLSVTGAFIEKNRMKKRIFAQFPKVNEIFIDVQAHPTKQECTSQTFEKNKPYRSVSIRSLDRRMEKKDENSGPKEKIIFTPGKKQALFQARSNAKIELDVNKAIKDAMLEEPIIQGLSHVLVHYNLEKGRDEESTSVSAEVNLRMDKGISLLTAEKAAEVAKKKILEIYDVESVDIHLELLD